MIDEMDYGFLTGHILHHGTENHLDPSWMTKELDEHGYSYGHDEVEHLMRNLVAKGFLDTDEEQYWTTDDGETFLEQLKKKGAEFNTEVVEG